MKYTIEFKSYNQNAESVISEALGFSHALSKEFILFHFANENTVKHGIFNNKKSAKACADRINKRGACGGFKHFVQAEVIKL